MRILLVLHASPFPPELGPARRHYHVLRELMKRHEVSVLSFGSVAQCQAFMKHFDGICRDAAFVDNGRHPATEALLRIWYTMTGRSELRHILHRSMQRAMDRLAAQPAFDVVLCSFPLFGHYRLPRGSVLVSDAHNVEHDVLERMWRQTDCLWRRIYYFAQARCTRRDEIATASRFDALLLTSGRDLELFRRHLPAQRFFVIPNGIEFPHYTPLPEAAEPNTLLFTGLMSYYPNEHAVLWFLDEVFPRIRAQIPDARLLVVGARPSRAMRARALADVIVTGYVPDVRPYFARAQAVVIPLRIGGGTRVKALEAMALGRPIVSTTLGCEGLDVTHETTALLADTACSFEDAVVRVLRDPALRARLSARAHELVRERYDWAVIGEELDRVLTSLTGNIKGPNRPESRPSCAADRSHRSSHADPSDERRFLPRQATG